MAQRTKTDESFYMNANMLLHILKQACELFECSEPATKNKILRFLLQNIKLEGKKLHFELKKPFLGVLQANTSNSLLPLKNALTQLNWRALRVELDAFVSTYSISLK